MEEGIDYLETSNGSSWLADLPVVAEVVYMVDATLPTDTVNRSTPADAEE
jgi:hypothetical protein